MKKSKFWKFYRILTVVLIIIFAIILAVLYFFLRDYEKSIPTHSVDTVISWINNNDSNNLSKYIKIDNSDVNDIDDVKSLLSFEKGDYFYTKNATLYKDNKPVYTIYLKNKQVGIVYLKKKKTSSLFKLNEWQIDYLDGFLSDKKDITIYAPNNSKVLLNNKEVNSKFIVDNEYYTDKMNYIKPYVNINALAKYVINDAIVNKVEVIYNDKTYELNNDNNIYTFKYDGNEEILNSVKSRLDAFVTSYTRYVVNETSFSSVNPYIISSSNAYSFLKQIALTNLWSGNHTPCTFSDIEYSNMQSYNDDAFEVEVNYNYKFNVYSNSKSFDTKLKLQVVKQNNNWYIVDLST